MNSTRPTTCRVRLGQSTDREQLARMRNALWPESSVDEHSEELVAILTGKAPGSLPLVILVAELPEEVLAGFMEVGLRSHADGCDPALPVGYVEGWYVSEQHRGKGLGAALMTAAEDWARTQGCVEMASDTWLDNHLSQRVHEALGFKVVDRCVNYRKKL